MALPVCFEVNPMENLHGFSNLCSLSRPCAVYTHSVWFHRHVHTASDRRIKWWCLSVQGYASKTFFFLSPLCAVLAVGRDNSLSNCIGFVSLTGQSLRRRPKISLQSAGKDSALQEHTTDISENRCGLSPARNKTKLLCNTKSATSTWCSAFTSPLCWYMSYVDRA